MFFKRPALYAPARKKAPIRSRRAVPVRFKMPRFMGAPTLAQDAYGSVRQQAGHRGAAVFKLPPHKEFLQDVYSSITFSTQQIPVNAALTACLPWGSQISSAFEKYRFKHLYFRYVPSSGTAVGSTNTALGTVIMTWVANPQAPAFTNKQHQEAYEGSVTFGPYQKAVCKVDCNKIMHQTNNYFCRTGAVPSGHEQKMYDMGVFNISTVGMQAAGNVQGEIHIVYELELYTPKTSEGKGGNMVLTDHFILTAANISSTAFFGTGPSTRTATSNLGGVLCTNGVYVAGGSTSGDLDNYVFPPNIRQGMFLYVYQVKGAATALTNAVTVSFGTNITAFSMWNANSGTTIGQVAGETASRQYIVGVCYFNGSNAADQSFIAVTGGTLPGTITHGDLLITQINPSQITSLPPSMTEKIREFRQMMDLLGIDPRRLDESKLYNSKLLESIPIVAGGPCPQDTKEAKQEDRDFDVASIPDEELEAEFVKRKEASRQPPGNATLNKVLQSKSLK